MLGVFCVSATVAVALVGYIVGYRHGRQDMPEHR